MNKRTAYILFSLSLLVLLSLSCWIYSRQPRIAFVKLQKVYGEFTFKKELEKKITDVTSARKNILDSMELRLKSMGLDLQHEKDKKIALQKREELRMRSEEYLLKKKGFLEDNERFSKDYEEQVLKQLNQYIFNYGKEKGIDIIYGANGNGSIMYGSDRFDISEDVLKYVNEQYAGKSK